MREPGTTVRRAAAAVLVLLLLMPFFAAFLAYMKLQSAVDAFKAAQEELVTGKGDVEGSLRSAISDADHGAQLMADPLLLGLAAVTGTGDDVAAARRLGDIAKDASKLALETWLLLDNLGQKVYSDGRIDFAVIDELRLGLIEHGHELDDLRARLAAGGRGSLAAVDSAFRNAEKQLMSASDALDTTEATMEVMPALFARDSVKRYLVAFLSPSEARGGGGMLGVYGVLHVRDGRLELGEVYPNETLNERLEDTKIEAPMWFEDLYGGLTALTDVRQSNLSPAFPATSRVVLEMYHRAYGTRLDGMIAMDPIVLGKLTRPLGPLSAPDWSVEITATNARRLLLRDIYQRFPRSLERAQNIYLSDLVDAVWRKIRAGNFAIGSMAAALADSAATQHLKVFSIDPEVQKALRGIGISGDPTTEGPNVQVFVHNNFTGSKVDHYISRLQEVDIELTEEGTAEVQSEVTIENSVPVEPVSVINRPLNKMYPVGLARMTTNFMLPKSAVVTSTTEDGRAKTFFSGTDSGHPMRWTSVYLPSGETVTLSIRYEIPKAVAGEEFRFTLWPQALPFPDHYVVTVTTGAGVKVIGGNFERSSDTNFEWQGALKTPRSFELRLE
jgi:hypothetical protein